MEQIWNSLVSRVADPHHVDADPESDPAFHFDADPDPTFHSDAGLDPDPTLNLMRIRILPLTFFQNLDPRMLQNDPLRLPPFHFDADPDPASQNDRNTARKTEKNIIERKR